MAATKNPTLCYLVAPTWEDPKRTIKIRQSDLDEARADIAARTERLNADMRGEAYVNNAEHAEWEVLDRHIGRIEEAISAQGQLDRHNYEDPCVARWA